MLKTNPYRQESNFMHTSATKRLSDEARRQLIDIARASILYGLEHGEALLPSAGDYAQELEVERASFVTLNRLGMLRGCIGHLEAIMPLAKDVAENAYSAAFRDPRFPSLTRDEYADLELHISILTPPEALEVNSESDLLTLLQPGIDGLILEDGAARGTFLPSVWESLPQPREFLRHLKRKAGLTEDYWSDTLKVSRYETESFTG
ncbi:MAG: AmmeMemoRadiSam system protein A [Chromatiales bacterium]